MKNGYPARPMAEKKGLELALQAHLGNRQCSCVTAILHFELTGYLALSLDKILASQCRARLHFLYMHCDILQTAINRQ